MWVCDYCGSIGRPRTLPTDVNPDQKWTCTRRIYRNLSPTIHTHPGYCYGRLVHTQSEDAYMEVLARVNPDVRFVEQLEELE